MLHSLAREFRWNEISLKDRESERARQFSGIALDTFVSHSMCIDDCTKLTFSDFYWLDIQFNRLNNYLKVRWTLFFSFSLKLFRRIVNLGKIGLSLSNIYSFILHFMWTVIKKIFPPILLKIISKFFCQVIFTSVSLKIFLLIHIFTFTSLSL